ncbi:hypothetical protein VNI00_001285 [Paramarasmius palmivorus]|uniref:Uncharacterized protein n=1 Tax=Paramarasmius palmivorus TaxID=297713 RepID=A0AAW0EBG4_9AGAR
MARTSIFVRPPSPPPRAPSPTPHTASLPPPRRPRPQHLQLHHTRSWDGGYATILEEERAKQKDEQATRDPTVRKTVSKGILKPSPAPRSNSSPLPSPLPPLSPRGSRVPLSSAIPYKSPPPSPTVTSPPPVPPLPAFAIEQASSPRTIHFPLSPTRTPSSPLPSPLPSPTPRKSSSLSVSMTVTSAVRKISLSVGLKSSQVHKKKSMSTSIQEGERSSLPYLSGSPRRRRGSGASSAI